jgi:hypothetical protein
MGYSYPQEGPSTQQQQQPVRREIHDGAPVTTQTPSYPQVPVYQQVSAQAVASHLEVIVPHGAYGGSVLRITNPQTGQVFQVTVPSGLQPGMKFMVQTEGKAPTQYAAPVQQPMTYHRQSRESDECGAFLLGACLFCWCCRF